MSYSKLPSSGVRRGVQVVTSLMLTLQIVSLAGTIVFFLYAKRADTKEVIARSIITTLYHREDWKWMRRTGALQVQNSFHVYRIFLIYFN